jgi:hypothetical protein
MKKGLSNMDRYAIIFTLRALVAIWLIWERWFHLFLKLQPVDPEYHLLHMRVCTYRGKTIQLGDGEEIRKGDRVVELHLDNEMLHSMGLQVRTPVQLAVQMIRSMEQRMPKLSNRIANDPNCMFVKGAYGITIIHRGTQQLGITIADLPKGIYYFFIRVYLRWLLFVIHPQGKQRLETKSKLLIPKTVAISTKELKSRFPQT